MATRDCWNCGVRAHMAPYESAYIVPLDNEAGQQVWCAFKCDNCGGMSIATAERLANDPMLRVEPTTWIDQTAAPKWLPLYPVGKTFPDVPERIAEAASEAYECRSVSACRASVQLARSVVEATAKDKGITSGSLMSKINELFNQRFIREHIRDGAHEVRHLGNDMAHGDFVDPVTADETDLVLTLMSEILEEVYQSPARVSRAQAARAAKKAASRIP